MADTTPTPAPKTYSGQNLADLLGVEGIKLRRYIRSDGTRVGRGRTYSFTAEESASILEGFIAQTEKIDLEDEEKATALKAEVTELLTPAPESTEE